jgi:hypothetical protein
MFSKSADSGWGKFAEGSMSFPLAMPHIVFPDDSGRMVTTKRWPNWNAVSIAACSAGPILGHRTLRPSGNVISYISSNVGSEGIGCTKWSVPMTRLLPLGGWGAGRSRGRAVGGRARNSTPNLASSFRHNGKVTVAGSVLRGPVRSRRGYVTISPVAPDAFSRCCASFS